MNDTLAKIIFDALDGASDSSESGVPYTYNAFSDRLEIGVDGPLDCKKFAGTLAAALAAEGFVIVPKEPTDEMVQSGFEAFRKASAELKAWLSGFEQRTGGKPSYIDPSFAQMYRAMLAAVVSK